MSPRTASPTRRPARSALLAVAIVAGVSVPASSALLAAERGDAVESAALSAGLQPAKRLVVPAATVPPPPPPTTQPSQPGPSAAEQRLLDLTNDERIRRGIAPLSYHPNLAAAALIHGNDQRNKPCVTGSLTHTGTDGSNAGDRIRRTGLEVRDWAENIACGFPTAQAVFDGWMASSGHRANILNPRLTHLGVSLTHSDRGTPYWVQVFALPR